MTNYEYLKQTILGKELSFDSGWRPTIIRELGYYLERFFPFILVDFDEPYFDKSNFKNDGKLRLVFENGLTKIYAEIEQNAVSLYELQENTKIEGFPYREFKPINNESIGQLVKEWLSEPLKEEY